ncbi:MAG: MBL fold metallo-hydrolase [Rhodothermia bacterium]|nr:MBL fold metallo-hydrolase [Rhodothermia bacterium]
MAFLHLLGTGAGYTDAWRTTTMLAFQDKESLIAVDCGGDLLQRLQAANCPLEDLKALFITHEHPDHCGGFPLFMEKRWLAGIHTPIHLYGPEKGLTQTRRAFEVFGLPSWKGMAEIVWHVLPLSEGVAAYEDDTWAITTSPTFHPVPTLGMRVVHKKSLFVTAYSCDTSPCPAVQHLAENADLLVHEANLIEGTLPNVHSSISEATDIAIASKAKRLVLVHVPKGISERHLAKDRLRYPHVEIGEELGAYGLG